MNEELMNKSTDLKDLFVQKKYEEMITFLDSLEQEEVKEMALYNVEIVNKYYETEKYDLLKQYITFVAFTSFLYEYAAKSKILDEGMVEKISVLFSNVYDVVKN